MMRSLFCGGYYAHAILGLINPPDYLRLNVVERMVFNRAARELMSSSSHPFADKLSNLADAADIVNSRPGFFWPVGYTSYPNTNGSKRQAICLALPIMWGAHWLGSSICICGDGNQAGRARDKLELLHKQCCSYLDNLEKDFDRNGRIYELAPIAQAVADAWKAVCRLGPVLILESPASVPDLLVIPGASHVV
jgi:hypothetical protein